MSIALTASMKGERGVAFTAPPTCIVVKPCVGDLPASDHTSRCLLLPLNYGFCAIALKIWASSAKAPQLKKKNSVGAPTSVITARIFTAKLWTPWTSLELVEQHSLTDAMPSGQRQTSLIFTTTRQHSNYSTTSQSVCVVFLQISLRPKSGQGPGIPYG